MQPVDDAAHALSGVVLHVAHIRAHDRQRELADHVAQFLHALLIGGDLRLQVVDVLQRIARRILAAGQQRIEFTLAETAALRQLEIVDVDAFLLDRGGVRRHRARRDAADIGMVAARGHPEQDRPALS